MKTIQHLWWIGAIAALAACDPWQATKGGVPTLMNVIVNGPGETVVQQAPAAPWTIEAQSTCALDEKTSAEVIKADEYILWVRASKLLDGATIEATPNTCIPAGETATTAGWLKVERLDEAGGQPTNDTDYWYTCYYPSSATPDEGGAVVLYRADGTERTAAGITQYGSGARNWATSTFPGSLATGDSWFDMGATLPARTDDRVTFVFSGTVSDQAQNPFPVEGTLRVLPDAGAATLAVEAVGADSITLTWAPGPCTSAAATYSVQQEDANGDWIEIAGGLTGAGGTLAPVTGLTYGSSYTFRLVQTITGVQSGIAFTKTKATVSQVVLAAPAAVVVDAVTANSVAMHWDAVDGAGAAVTYVVERSQGGLDFIPVADGLTATSFTQKGLEPGVTYAFRVYAVTENGTSLPSAVTEATTIPAPPAAPTFANVTATTVDVSWAEVAGATSYVVQHAEGTGAFVTDATVTAPTVTYAATGLTASTAYAFRVIAVNASGESTPGAAAAVTTAP